MVCICVVGYDYSAWYGAQPGNYDLLHVEYCQVSLMLNSRKGICKITEWWGTGMVICLERGADLHAPQLMPLPFTVSCISASDSLCEKCTCYTAVHELLIARS